MRRFLSLLVLAAALTATQAWADDNSVTGTADPAKECKSYGLEPGTDGYNGCVASLSGKGTDLNKMRGDMDRDRAAMRKQMDDDMARQRADMKKQMDEQRRQMDADLNAKLHPADGSPTKCVTTTDGSNTSISCP